MPCVITRAFWAESAVYRCSRAEDQQIYSPRIVISQHNQACWSEVVGTALPTTLLAWPKLHR